LSAISYHKLSRREERIEEQLLRSGRYEEADEMAQSVFERLEARARQEGVAAALQRSALLVIQSRFPHAPARIASQIATVEDPTRLEELIRRASQAASLDEIEPLLGS
jgi:hypothetical protein